MFAIIYNGRHFYFHILFLHMAISIGQLIILAVCLIILFGNVPKLFKDIGRGIQEFKEAVKDDKDKDNEKKRIDK